MPEAAWRRRFRAPRVGFPHWALDAPHHMVYASNAPGKWEVFAWDQTRGTHRQVTDRPDGTMQGALDRVGRRIWWFDDMRGNELGRWQIEPFDGGPHASAADLPPGYSAGLALGREIAVLGLSGDAGAAIHLVRPAHPPAALYAHREHAFVGWLSRDETLVAIAHSEHGDSRHPAARVLDLAGRAIAEMWDGPGLGLHPGEWSPIHGDGRLIVASDRHDVARPLLWEPASGRVVDLHPDLPGEVDATWYPDGRSLLLLHDYRGRSDLYRLTLDTGALERLPTEPGTITLARVRPVEAGAGIAPGESVEAGAEVWYAWTRAATATEVRALPADPGASHAAGSWVVLRAPGEPAPEGASYADRFVSAVHVFLAEPAGRRRPHPAVVLVHGGPAAQDRDAFSPVVQAWVDHDFAVVLVNYRGSSGYGRAWRDAIQGNPGLTELDDLAAVRDALVAEGAIDPTRTVLAGRSWGGYLTLLGLGLQPERWALGLAAVPVADYVAAYEDEMEPLRAYDKALFGGTPTEIPDAYLIRSPMTYADRVRAPVLILAGENDPRCPIRQIDNYVARLRDLGKVHEVYRYQAGHSALVVDEAIRQTEVQIAFAARHLGTPPPR